MEQIAEEHVLLIEDLEASALSPIKRKVLIRPDETPGKFNPDGLIYIPEIDQKPATTGTVVSLGDITDDFEVKIGDKVYFVRYAGWKIEIKGHYYRMVEQDDIFLILN